MSIRRPASAGAPGFSCGDGAWSVATYVLALYLDLVTSFEFASNLVTLTDRPIGYWDVKSSSYGPLPSYRPKRIGLV